MRPEMLTPVRYDNVLNGSANAAFSDRTERVGNYFFDARLSKGFVFRFMYHIL